MKISTTRNRRGPRLISFTKINADLLGAIFFAPGHFPANIATIYSHPENVVICNRLTEDGPPGADGAAAVTAAAPPNFNAPPNNERRGLQVIHAL